MKQFLFLLTFVFVQTSFALTLDDAIQSGLDHAVDLKVLKLQLQSSQESRKKAESGFLPTIDFIGRHHLKEEYQESVEQSGKQKLINNSVDPYTTLGLQLEWNLYNGNKNHYELAAALDEELIAQATYERAQDQKKIQIRTLYSKALAMQILVEVAEKNLTSLQSHFNEVMARIESGVSTRYDSLRVEVQIEEASTEKLFAENAVKSSRAQLFEAMGIEDDGRILTGQLMTEFTQVDLTQLLAKIDERADRIALVSQRDRAEKLSKAAESYRLPKLSLYGNYEIDNQFSQSPDQASEKLKSAYQIGFQLSWNLFDGGYEVANHKKAILNQMTADLALVQFDQIAKKKVLEIQNQFSFDLVNYQSKLSQVRKAEEAVHLATEGFKVGTRTNSEILEAVVEMNKARAAAVKSQLAAIEDLGQLELTLGVMLFK